MDTRSFIGTLVDQHGVVSSIEFEAENDFLAFREIHSNEVLLNRLLSGAHAPVDPATVVDPLGGYWIEVKPKSDDQMVMLLESSGSDVALKP